MIPQAQLDDIENCAKKLSIEIIYRDLTDMEFSFQSGYCKINGSQKIILDKKLSIEEQINIILQGFKSLDLQYIQFDKVHRQKDKVFRDRLLDIREGVVNRSVLDFFNHAKRWKRVQMCYASCEPYPLSVRYTIYVIF